jgi:hypothetical protein
MTDEQVEKIIRSNMMLQMNLAGIRADFEEALQRTWVGLTTEEREQVQTESYGKVPHHIALIAAVEAKLKEKNT